MYNELYITVRKHMIFTGDWGKKINKPTLSAGRSGADTRR